VAIPLYYRHTATAVVCSMAKVFVGRLSPDADERDLEEVFKSYGQITKIDVKQGYAFVHFQDGRDADEAMRGLQGYDIKGSLITVQPAKGPKDNRDRIPKVFGCFGWSSVALIHSRQTFECSLKVSIHQQVGKISKTLHARLGSPYSRFSEMRYPLSSP
jgi:RNA recognition motif-containing protein